MQDYREKPFLLSLKKDLYEVYRSNIVRKEILLSAFLLFSMGCRTFGPDWGSGGSQLKKSPSNVQVAVYYFPLWHHQPEDKLFPHLHDTPEKIPAKFLASGNQLWLRFLVLKAMFSLRFLSGVWR